MENKHHEDKKVKDLENGMNIINIKPKKGNKTSATDAFQCKDCDFETNSKQCLNPKCQECTHNMKKKKISKNLSSL